MAGIFGWLLKRKDDEALPSVVEPNTDDGATILQAPTAFGGSMGTFLDLSGGVRNEAELITRYRLMSLDPEVEPAIDNIVNEAIVTDDDEPTVQIKLDDLKNLPGNIKAIIEEQFLNILQLLEFNSTAYEIFKRWYIDGRLYYHCIIDRQAPQNGIQELRYIDPRKIKKIKEVRKERAQDNSQALITKVVNEYYLFNDAGFDQKPQPGYQQTSAIENGIKIAKDAIVYTNSGQLDESGRMVISYLNKAIRPLNMLRTQEDAAIIYRLVRCPERRIWYIDVGNLPKPRAEQYISEMMTKYKNKVVYDPTTGQVRDDRKHMNMSEDIWLSRREGGRGTEVSTLPGATPNEAMDEIQYFLKKLYKALQVPISRLDPDMTVSLGQATEITRDEVIFARFIDRIRLRFNGLFLDLLEKQLVLAGVLTPEDWKQIKQEIKFVYARDNYFSELKDQRILQERMGTAQLMLPVTGRFYSNEWVRRHVLKQDDEEMEEIDEQILEERENPIYMVPLDPEGQPMAIEPGLGVPGGPPGGEAPPGMQADGETGSEPPPKAKK